MLTVYAPRRRAVFAGALLFLIAGLSAQPSVASGIEREIAPLSQSTPLAPGARPIGIAIDATTGHVYVTNSGDDTLAVIDHKSGSVLASLPTGHTPNQVAVNVGTGRVYVSNFDDASVTIVDGRAMSVVATLPVGGLGLALDAKTGRVFAAEGRRLAIIDGTADKVFDEIDAPSGANLWGVVVANGLVYISDLFAPRLVVFDPARSVFVGEIAMDAPVRFALAASADGAKLYAASYQASAARLSVVDAAARKVAWTVAVGPLPFGIALDPAKSVVYVTSFSSGQVTVIDSSSRSAAMPLSAGRSAAGIAFDPASGRLFVADADAAVEAQP